ncbi:AIPR family protein [Sorangium sp. So ce362]|uniref:AIPR family protein n=1 Tax=Sorangium sp. So ce362 TaxID=3133303 RepID=UPI003F635336
MATLQQFGQELIDTLGERCETTAADFEEILLRHVFGLLEDDTVQEDLTLCFHKREDMYADPPDLELKVNGYDVRDEGATLDLFVVLGFPDQPCERVAPADANMAFRAVQAFFERSRKGLAADLEGDEAEPLAQQIGGLQALQEVNLTLVTNGEVRNCDRSTSTLDGIVVKRKVLDLRGIQRLNEPDDIIVEFSSNDQVGLACVQLPQENGVFRSYLAVVPGSALADLYGKHGQRMLEANVRAYLKSGGKVNRGIIQTVADSPHMFFAYNNGITAIAEGLDVRPEKDGLRIMRCRNLQIVNGGQTTASIYHAKRTGKKLDGVFVAMKISEVLDPSRSEDIVQKISQFANSQNKVNFSDLGSNRSFHVELHRLSQVQVPKGPFSNGRGASRWFYERMRGQYDNELGRLKTSSQKKDFRARFPSSQCITKTDVARYIMIWERLPHVVGTGAEKNYVAFQRRFIDEMKVVPGEEWFQELIGKAIIIEACDRLVRLTRIPGYKANIVAYAVALLTEKHSDAINLRRVWHEQRVPKKAEDWMVAAIPQVRYHLVHPETPGMNVTEWAKKPRCWEKLLEDGVTAGW